MATIENTSENTPVRWSIYKKIAFRIAFVFFLLVSIPLSSGWYKSLAAIDWLNPHYRDIYSIARYGTNVPSLFGSSGRQGAGEGEEGEGGQLERGAGGRGTKRQQRDSVGGNRNEPARDTLSNAPGARKKKRHRDSTAAGGEITLAGAKDGGDREGRRAGFGRKHRRDSLGNGQLTDTTSTIAGGGERKRGGFGRKHRRDSLNQVEGTTTSLAVADRGEERKRGGFARRQQRDSLNGAAGRPDGQRFAKSFGKLNRRNDSSKRNFRAKNQQEDSVRSTGVSADRNDGGRPNRENSDAPPQVRSRSWLSDYSAWGNALVIAVIVGLIWTLLDRKRPSYNVLYYWLTVVVRFRAAIGIIGFGFTKLFPTQMPFPSLGLLNTDFGDFTAQKIYWMSVGIVPWYQVFGGIVEITAGILLFFRKTATYGAILLIGALGDITFVNYSYDGGVHVYALYFVLLGAFVVAADVPRLYNLLIRERYTVPHFYYPDYSKTAYKYTRLGLKSLAFLIFFVILTYTEVINFKYDPYKQPSTAGVKTLRGNYNVTEFRINGQVIPYSPVDSVRWKEATFENWTTLTFRINKPVVIDPSNGGGSPMRDVQRTFEIAGTAGGQRAFHYYADTIEHVLYLQDKNAVASRQRAPDGRGGNDQGQRSTNPEQKQKSWISEAAWKNIGDENKMIDKRAWSTRRDREFARPERSNSRAKLILNYSTTDGNRIILSGINENKDSLYIVLDRYNRKYVLPESTLKAGKY